MIFISKRGGLILPELRTAPAYIIGGSPAITQQVGTLVGDLVVVVAYSTSGTAPNEAVPGALMTTVSVLTAIRSGRIAYRIATVAGTASLTTWTGGTGAYGIFTFKAGTFNPTTPFNNGGSTYFFTSEPDGRVDYPALTAPPNAKCLGLWISFTNLGPTHFGEVTSTTTMWDRDISSWYSRGMYRAQGSAFAGQSVNHLSGSAAQTLAFSGYIVGATT
jgi:hypothetical protein